MASPRPSPGSLCTPSSTSSTDTSTAGANASVSHPASRCLITAGPYRTASHRRLGIMAYDEGLAERVRARLGDAPARRMFGGLVFLRDGAIAAGVYGPDLLVRVAPDAMAATLARP